jgi:membrane-bound lytic murein transglycosylase F
VAAPRQARITDGYGPEQELLTRFQKDYGVSVKLVLTDTAEEAVDLVEQGKAHVGLALGVAPQGPAVEGKRANSAEAKAARLIAYGPQYDVQPIYAVAWNEGYIPPEHMGPYDAPKLTPALDELVRVARSFSQDPTLAPALPLDALLLLIPLLPEVHDTAPTGLVAGSCFVWRKDVPRLDASMKEFWTKVQEDGTLTALCQRTLGYLPEDPDPVEMELLRNTLARNAVPLAQAIRKASHKAQVDPFLLMAIIHQESHFNPNAVSATGVRGLMQMTNTTLDHLDVQDPENHAEVISAGARYLATLRSGYTEMGYGQEDAQWLALAAFNVGQGHVQDAIELVRDGDNATLPSWQDVRAMLPKLTKIEVARQTKYGLCRGFEAVDFVDKVRYFAYAIKRLVFSAGTQGDELASLHLALAR